LITPPQSDSSAGDALVHVPAERADHPDVVVVIHLAVGDEVEARLLLVVDHDLGRVLIRLLMVDVLERHAHITSKQLIVEPMRSGIGPHHRRRQDVIGNLPRHSTPPGDAAYTAS